jgi:TolB protein
MSRKIFFILCVVLAGVVSNLAAKIYIYIDAPATTKFPIAVADFKNIGAAPDIQGISSFLPSVISDNLEVSGLFGLIDPDSFLEDPDASGITGDQIVWRDWSSIGTEALIKGGIAIEGDMVRVEARLFDVVRGDFISGKRYFAKPDNLRLIAHKFSDETIYRLTGQRGIFQTQIVFVSTLSGNKEVYIVDFDGQNRKKITNHKSIILSPAWSPEGKRLLFTSYRDGNPDVFMREILYGKEKKVSHRKGLNISPEWAPDGRKIVLTLSQDDGNSDIYIMTLEGSEVKRLTSAWANDVSPCWSPQGSHLAFVSNRSGSPQIYVMESDGGKVRRLTFEGSYNTSPAWSPKGDKVAFAGIRGPAFEIFTINVDGSGLRQLTESAGSNEAPSWSPDGRHIVYSSNKSGRKKIYIMRSDGSGERMITGGGGDDTDPCWSPYLDYR